MATVKKLWIVLLLVWGTVVFNPGLSNGSEPVMGLDEGLDYLAGQLTKSLPSGSHLTVAVTDFRDLQNHLSGFGRFLAEEMATRLAGKGRIQLIEQGQLEKAIEELRFNQKDLFDPVLAKKLGKWVGADTLLVGTVTDLGTTVRINTRFYSTERRDVLTVATVTMLKDDRVVRLLNIPLESHPSNSGNYPQIAEKPIEQPAPIKPKEEDPVFQNDFIKVTVKSLEKSRNNLVLEIWYENLTENNLMLISSNWGTAYSSDQRGTYLLSSEGEKWLFQEDSEVGKHYGGIELIPHQRLLNRLIFAPNKSLQDSVFTYIGDYRVLWRSDPREGFKQENFQVVIRNLKLNNP
ncbi:MAG: hypothetical protein HY202_03240 [Nitrospirae bacterium]|nr:hypothetical protein [Nitrospirota bacterium]